VLEREPTPISSSEMLDMTYTFIDVSGFKSRKWKRDRRVTELEFAFACCTQSVAFALRGCPGERGGGGGLLLLRDDSQRKSPRSVSTNMYKSVRGWSGIAVY
jgi:hypothetical protein